MDTQSEAFLSSLAIFEQPSTLLTVQSNFVEEVPTKSSLVGDVSVLSFSIPASPTLYTDLTKTYLQMNVKIVRADGSNQQAADSVGPVHNVLGSLIRTVDLTINDVLVASTYNSYSFISFLENFMGSLE